MSGGLLTGSLYQPEQQGVESFAPLPPAHPPLVKPFLVAAGCESLPCPHSGKSAFLFLR